MPTRERDEHPIQVIQDALPTPFDTGYRSENDLNLTTVLCDVLSDIVERIGADVGNILVLDEGGWPSHWFIWQDGQGQLASLTRAWSIMKHGLINWVIEQRQEERIDDLTGDPRWSPLAELPDSAEWRSALLLPLMTVRVTGVLLLFHRQAGYFGSQHLDLLQAMAQSIAFSIENARLYDEVRQRAEEMAALYEVALNISTDQPLDRLLDTIVAQAMDLLNCQGGGLFLWREQEGILELVAAYDPEIDLRGTRVVPGEGLVGRVFKTGDPLAMDDYGIAGANDLSSGLPSTAAIAVPIVWQGQRIGVLTTTDRAPGRYFGHNDRHLLTLLANQAAAAIFGAQLHEQTSRRLQELAFLNETIQDITATMELGEILEILTQKVKDLLQIEACSIALVDHETQELVFQIASGGGADTVKGERVPWGQGIVGAAAQSRQPVNVPDVRRDERFFQDIDKKQTGFITHSILAVPMMSRGQVAGVVEALNKPGGFDEEDTRLLSALAGLAASVVENAHLFNSVRAAEARYQALFQKSADAVWVTDVAGKILQVNQKAAALTGHADKDLPGTLLWSLTLPEERDKWRQMLTRAVDGQEPTLESWIIGANDALRPLELRLKWIRAAESDRVQWIGRDISARRELEQLRQDLTHMIVHDLRSPMGTVSNSLELLKEATEEDEPQSVTQLISIASRATQRLSNLVDSLLDISRLEAGQELTDRAPISIHPLIESAVEQLALYVQGKRMTLNIHVPERLPVIMADSAMIERVLVNLIGNALKFTPSGGEITVAAEAGEEMLQVRVRDTGPGIAPQHQRWIFDKFARVRDQASGKGIGLGLAFCRLAVEAHGGRIWVESALGKGATFIFTIPLGQDSADQTDHPSEV